MSQLPTSPSSVQPSSGRLAPWLYAASLVAAPLISRWILLSEKNLAGALGDVHGILEDLAVALLVAGIGLILLRTSRLLAVAWGFVWLLTVTTNDEYVRFFDSPADFTYIGYLSDPTFVRGSALRLSHPYIGLGLLLWLLGSALRARKPASWGLPTGSIGLAALCALAASLWHPAETMRPWRQRNSVWLTIAQAGSQERKLPPPAPIPREIQTLLGANLAGTPRFSYPLPKRPNVLLIFLESVSGAYLPSLATAEGLPPTTPMQHLDDLGAGTLRFRSFFTHQRQTNRGEYTLLCGDYPPLLTPGDKTRNPTHTCLPALLREAGYRTSYLQAAPLNFMHKDTFMPRAGFDTSRGEVGLERTLLRNAWGADDKAYFESCLIEIRKLREDPGKPWFLTLLNVGTHHPYVFPDDFLATDPNLDKRQRAFLYLDLAIHEFIETLRKEGILENTLVLVTSDESAGVSKEVDDHAALVTQNWGLLDVYVPGGGSGTVGLVQEPYVQSDLALSVLDFLGLAPAGRHLMGRSVFRKYDQPRPVFSANTYAKKVLSFAPDGVYTICPENLAAEKCTHFQIDPLHPFSRQRTEVQPADAAARVQRLAQVVDATRDRAPEEAVQEGGAVELMQPGSFQMQNDSALRTVFSGHRMAVAAKTRIRVELEIEVAGKDGIVRLSHDLHNTNGLWYQTDLPTFANGGSLKLRYSVVLDQNTPHLEARLYARTIAPGAVLNIKKAQLTREPAGDAAPGVLVEQQEIQPGTLPESLTLRAIQRGPFPISKCLKPRLDGGWDGVCGDGYLIFGPNVRLPKDLRVEAFFDVEIVEGTSKVLADLTGDYGQKLLARSDYVVATGPQRVKLEVKTDLQADIERLEARVGLASSSGPVSVLVHPGHVRLTRIVPGTPETTTPP